MELWQRTKTQGMKIKLDLLLIIKKIKIPTYFLTSCEIMFKMGLLCCNYETRTKIEKLVFFVEWRNISISFAHVEICLSLCKGFLLFHMMDCNGCGSVSIRFDFKAKKPNRTDYLKQKPNQTIYELSSI